MALFERTESGLSSTSVALISILVTCVFVLVRRGYPHPLPGIPYNERSTRRLMGDLPEIAEFGTKAGSFRLWFVEQGTRHNSAITQIFLGPFLKPAVIVSDYREVHDILSHRDAVDFKRGKKVDAFRGILPHAFPAMETFHQHFKPSRDLARDLMTPSILNNVNAPKIHDVTTNLLQLWRLKMESADGRAFDVSHDVSEFSFDAILSAATGLGLDGGDIKCQFLHLQRSTPITQSGNDSTVISFPSTPTSSKLAALRVDEDSLWKGFVVPWPGLYHTLNNLRPKVRRARRILQNHIASQIALNLSLFQSGAEKEPACALEYVMQRELLAAQKAGRPPVLDDPRILEPIYGYLIAGHDTSSGSLLWIIRRLVAHPREQNLIRQSLRETYDNAWREKRLPTAAELVKVRCPYLDAFIEETLRLNPPVVNIMVQTRYDTQVLGRHIPADTSVFLNLSGPSINEPSIFVQENHRSPTSLHSHPAQKDNWDGDDPFGFRPERWLTRDSSGSGKQVFNAGQGPALAFSAGNRGCWGKRLGYLELRIVASLLVWEFEFQGVPAELVSWETYDSLVTAPKECYVRLAEASG
ncbi:cytochrome P450 [Podospora australis]|uniref:Cytochrome P450 n=1 Tax=Podospora australis TaxID=1536484 RepID=A0AAN6WRL3_9PEZI|nr:cytochrome P450 [Podospora australis]